jgi:hypothetical protein
VRLQKTSATTSAAVVRAAAPPLSGSAEYPSTRCDAETTDGQPKLIGADRRGRNPVRYEHRSAGWRARVRAAWAVQGVTHACAHS